MRESGYSETSVGAHLALEECLEAHNRLAYLVMLLPKGGPEVGLVIN